MVRILHISTTDNAGGSGRSAYRIHTGLKRLGHRSRMLVSHRVTDDPDVQPIWGTLPWRAADWIARRVIDRLSLQYLLYPSSFGLLRHPWFLESDILQLYNTHGGYFSHTALPFLSRQRPVVWRLSDMWPMTGHCAYSFDCDRWKTGCGACPLLSDEPALQVDRTAFLWKVKRRIYERTEMTIVAPSLWIAGLAAQSPLLGRYRIHHIANGLDTNVFRPIPKSVAREALGLDPKEDVVLFSAVETGSRRKGGHALREALHILRDQGHHRLRLLAVGNGAEQWGKAIDIPVTPMSVIKDDRLLAMVYSAADILVYPTLAENLPNGVIESMACGTPVVAFNVGGVSEAVRSMDTGYLAAQENAADLARGISLLLKDRGLQKRLAHRGREVVEAEYSFDLQVRRFHELYQDILRAKISMNSRQSRQPKE